MINRVAENYKKGKRTHIFIDEVHVLFANEYSRAFFNNAWRQFRKRNAYPTAITQNVEYLLASNEASSMFETVFSHMLSFGTIATTGKLSSSKAIGPCFISPAG